MTKLEELKAAHDAAYDAYEVELKKQEGNRMIEYTVKAYHNGDKIWCLNGKVHREDGPAVEYANGHKVWYLNGKNLTEQEHKKATTKATCVGKEVEIDGVTYVLKLKGQYDDDLD